MADLSDVTAYLAARVAAIVYPNGAGQPSIAPVPVGFANPADVRIYEGWPVPEQLDLDLSGRKDPGGGGKPTSRANGPFPNVSVYPLPGASSAPYQVLDKTRVLQEPVLGLSVAVAGNAITITGTPGAGEFVTIAADRAYVFSRGGVSAAAVLAALLADVQAQYPGASLSGSTLTVPAVYELDVRQGGVGLLGKVTHRQCHMVMISVWAQDNVTRSVLAKAIDAALKSTIVVTLDDGSELKLTYSRTMVSDEMQNVTAYRRDLVFECEYATLETFPGTTITSVGLTIEKTTDEGSAPQASVVI